MLANLKSDFEEELYFMTNFRLLDPQAEILQTLLVPDALNLDRSSGIYT